MKISVNDILAKKNREKISCLTAYTFPIAKILDEVCDVILVGDSLGMCVYGFDDTVDVSVGMMIDHGRAVVKACKRAFVVVDIPANSFEESSLQALQTAQKIIDETACDAVKIETGKNQIEAIALMAQNGINVMAHIGLLPQQVRELGGYKYQGRNAESAQKIIEIALASQEAGAFAIVIEAVPAWLADEITARLKIPTIGIGASKNCDGQVLVIDDVLGLNQEFKPKFVKNYENMAEIVKKAAKNFDFEVKNGIFPEKSNLLEK
jgi:3-methyl-2-oxobutanoate hydroxymethyltransferase